MLRSIAKWYVSRAIDCNRALPAWVERRLALDPSLKQFYDQSRKLAERMRTTVATPAYSLGLDWKVDVGTPFREAKLHSKQVRSKHAPALFTTFAIGLAAITLLALTPFLEYRNKNAKADPTDQSETSSAVGSEPAPVEPNQIDRKRFSELLASGKDYLQGLKQEAEGADVAELKSDLEHLAAFANLNVDQIIQPVSDLGTSYGAMLSQIDQQVETENRLLISGGVGAWQYFVHKLPKSAASLAGL